MKTLLIAVMMLFALTASQAQIKGVPINKAVHAEDLELHTVKDMHDILTKIDREDIVVYAYFYEVKGKGYYDALKRLEKILEANDIKRSPDVDDTYFPSSVDEHDYNIVALALFGEIGWIEKSWSVYDGQWKIVMVGDADAISVAVIHFKSSAAMENAWRSLVNPPVEEEPWKVNERALNRGRANTDETSGSEGITEGDGNQGSITGSPDSDNYLDGLSSGRGGIDFSLTGRNPVSLPKPEYNVQEVGKVVIKIRVNRDGVVTYAEAGAQGTNTLNKELLEAARKAALKARFNSSPDAAFTQQGTITYHFVFQ